MTKTTRRSWRGGGSMPDLSSAWRDANAVTDWEFARVGERVLSIAPRDLALKGVRLEGQIEVYRALQAGKTARAPVGSINADLAQELHKRYEMGLEKYGIPLDANDATIPERLQHIKEELMDALCYVEWTLREMRRLGL
jgi:hypothetical protein